MTADEDSGIVVEHLGNGVATVLLNRPSKLNALSSIALAELVEACGQLGRNPDVRAVVLSGRGRAFSSGGDLGELHPLLSEAGVNGARLYMRTFHDAITAIRRIPVPVVAAVNGACAGAGISVALACDLVIAARDAVFHPSFTRAGLIPDLGALHLWTRVVGPHRAKEMAFFAEPIPAPDALALGLVNRVVDEGTVLEHGIGLAGRLAKGPTAAYQMIKEIINTTDQAGLESVFHLESYAQSAAFLTGEVDEGVSAFHERRVANFGPQS
ncbi:enoyl-CoA hydratase/isomerase family protein [Microbacterium aerolatum]|uniref:enoyl-CoA hydratase/isomerase family protein n=1 Tax=Microbacterium aerolatum TaxID=153731 RepID=UPI002000BD39|nr:enoyl-CoA hydratase/isomerase family protein [Microbacterium aerolatum]MCK3771125.1 enoyl-CoA hydratase/isomerase family protein [Microbacterium aerolatum]